MSVGVDHDTPDFAVTSIETWWKHVGQPRYPNAREIFITADASGSNGHRPRMWKAELQRLADKLDLAIHVSHFPPGTSKWNKISTGKKISTKDFRALKIERDDFHGDWNYVVKPHKEMQWPVDLGIRGP